MPPLPSGPASEQAALELDHRDLVARLREGWPAGAVPEVGDEPLHQVLHAVSAALLTGDPRPIAETAAWIEDFTRLRGVDAAAVRRLGAVACAVLHDYPQARELMVRHFAGELSG